MECKVCKRETNEGEVICVLCQGVMQTCLKEAKDYFNQHDFTLAMEAVNKALQIDSASGEGKDLKAQIQEKTKLIQELKVKVEECIQGNLYQEAATHLNELVKLAPQDKEIQLHKQMIELVTLTDPTTFIRKSRHKFKPSDWTNVEYKLPSSSVFLVVILVFIIGVGYLASNIYKSQFETTPSQDIYLKLRRIIAKKEYYSGAFLAEYKILMRDYGNTGYAQKLKKEFQKISPRLIRAYIARGKELFSQGRFQEAIEEYNKVFAIDALNKEVVPLIEAAKDKLSLQDLSVPVLGFSNLRPASVSLAVSEIAKDASEEAQQYLIDGEQDFREERYLEAIAQWLKASRLVLEKDKKRIQELIEQARAFLLDKEKQYPLLIEEGEEFFKEQNLSDALVAFEKALKINPRDAYVQERVRQINYILSPPALPHARSGVVNLFSLLRSYLDYKRQEDKKEKFKFYYQLAIREEENHNFLKANYYYKKAARYYEASLYIAKQIKVNNILIEVEKRLQEQPNDYNAKFSLGCLFYAKGWLSKAEKTLAGLSAKDKEGIGFLAYIFQAKIAQMRNQFSEAQKIYEQALSRGNIFYISNSLAKLYSEQGFTEEAMRQWQAILDEHPQQLSILNSLARAYLLLGELAKAATLLDGIVKLTPLQLKNQQSYPEEVDPEYLVGLVSEREYFYQAAKDLSELYFDLGNMADSIRWRRISLQLEEKK